MNRRSIIASLFAMVLAPLGFRLPQPVSLSTHWTSPDMKLEPDGFTIDYIEGSITPIRRYQRIHLDNLAVLQHASTNDDEFSALWEAWSKEQARMNGGD
ncbi:hypothetical protein LCGC14_1659460 [marine sediment metagenome]|uniref:Uncharacterized protein n=1 Tax=marine sediment metagenome TaxID=412755 RepID=A0A0F9HVB2_9ZZZZ